jgi:mono/diheme cytochrome c family protein
MALATSLDPTQVPPTPAIAKSAATAPAVAGNAAEHTATPVEFARDIQPLLERSCVGCHSGGARAKGGFQVTDRAALLQGGKRGEPAVVPGKPDASRLLHFVQDEVEDLEMPPVGKRAKYPALTKDEIAKLSGWIAQGADWPQGTTLQVPAH